MSPAEALEALKAARENLEVAEANRPVNLPDFLDDDFLSPTHDAAFALERAYGEAFEAYHKANQAWLATQPEGPM